VRLATMPHASRDITCPDGSRKSKPNPDGPGGATVRAYWCVWSTYSVRTSDSARDVCASAARAPYSRERIRQGSSPPRSVLEAYWTSHAAPEYSFPRCDDSMIPDAVKMFIPSTFCCGASPAFRTSANARIYRTSASLPMMPHLPLLRVLWRTHEHSQILIRETCLAVAVFQS
jgi:hypothetical protein